MGKIIKIVIISLIMLVVLFRILHNEDILFRIYTENNKNLYYLLGYLPENIRDNYVKTPYENNGIGTVYILTNKYEHGSYVIYDNTKEVDFLVAYPPSLIYRPKELKNVPISNFVSYMVNLKVFNRYITDSQIREKEQIKSKYFEFIARGSKSYHIIRDTSDLTFIKRNFTVFSNSGSTNEDLNPNMITNNNKVDYCWYINMGVVQFQFYFDKKKIVKVESEIIGYLGNEFIYMQ